MQVKAMAGSSGKVFLPLNFIKQHSLEEAVYITLRVGSLVRKVKCEPLINGASDVVFLSEDIIDETNLPKNLNYDVFARNMELHVGPVLGLLVSAKEEHMTPKRLEHYLLYVERYAEVKGLVIAFFLEGMIDKEKKVIGYAYDPVLGSWKRGVFVFPGALYIRRAHINLNLHNRLLSLVGDRFFNSYAFDKWEMWQWLSVSHQIKSHLPETVLLSDFPGIQKLHKKNTGIILKPIRGYRGLGIDVVEKTGHNVILKYSEEQKNLSLLFSSFDALYKYLSDNVNINRYLGQKMINLIRLDDCLVDLRVIAQKGKFGTWQVQGIVSRQGPRDSTVSNVSRGGVAESAWKTLSIYFGTDSDVSFAKWAEIENLVIKACEQLERTGFRYGNLGFDIAVDTNGHIWIIEINNIYPDHTIALDANDPLLYKSVMATPLLYLKWLAGF